VGRRTLCGVAIIAGLTGAAGAEGEVTTEVAEARLDWTHGEIAARGAATADLHAPTIAIARVGAERRARERAAAALVTAARALRLAGGGTLGGAMKRDGELAARVVAGLAQTRDVAVDHASDGSARVAIAAPLEALRIARTGVVGGIAASTAPTALLIDAGAKLGQPVLGLTLAAGRERFAGPVVFFRDRAAAASDRRLGSRVVRGRATAIADGVLTIDGPAADVLAEARSADALVVIVLGDAGSSSTKKEKR
jgi:hypothetical protein